MGNYLNSMSAYTLYSKAVGSPYFADKTDILDQIIPRIETTENYICITRPRRFGKTIMANMITSFLSKGCDARSLFENLKIASSDCYERNINKHNVIFISFNEIPRHCKSYEQYIDRIEGKLIKDLKESYPDVEIDETDAVWDVFKSIYNADNTARFIFVLDEWDYIFHRDFVTDDDRAAYIDFLSNLLKGMPYVSLAYMTGILPIAKYSSGSELNMFLEYTMASEELYSDYFGFTESEVDKLYQKYLTYQSNPKVTREELREWYDGYHTQSGERVYNPRSVVASLTNNNLGNYWTSAGPYDEIYYYIEHNTDAVRDDLARMVSGIAVPAKIKEYAATSMNLTTKDEIFSAMVVYGFLSYEKGCVSIPNRELMDKFSAMLQKEASLGYVYQLAKESEKMLKATLSGDTATMVQILEFAHNTEIPLLNYSSETDLTAVVNLVYLSARDSYRIEREDKAGVGYVDFIFYPELDTKADCIILELKVNHTAEEAVQQIKDKQYALKFAPKLGEKRKYTGRILAVGIAYDKETKKHSCRIEVLS
ncbi:MAG: AAA family ATPase [Lachnospiraceae bacterium]|nr:AAA family ATPase [Lachnospiraceae bacterium]